MTKKQVMPNQRHVQKAVLLASEAKEGTAEGLYTYEQHYS
jgi:hypothetical protein